MIRVKKIPRWIWPLGIAAAGIGAAGAVLLRGCWHRNMSWPTRHGEHAYQVCNDCGIMRLFDEKTFQLYGPYGYDLEELIALERAHRMKRVRKAEAAKSSAEAGKHSPSAAKTPKSGTES